MIDKSFVFNEKDLLSPNEPSTPPNPFLTDFSVIEPEVRLPKPDPYKFPTHQASKVDPPLSPINEIYNKLKAYNDKSLKKDGDELLRKSQAPVEPPTADQLVSMQRSVGNPQSLKQSQNYSWKMPDAAPLKPSLPLQNPLFSTTGASNPATQTPPLNQPATIPPRIITTESFVKQVDPPRPLEAEPPTLDAAQHTSYDSKIKELEYKKIHRFSVAVARHDEQHYLVTTDACDKLLQSFGYLYRSENIEHILIDKREVESLAFCDLKKDYDFLQKHEQNLKKIINLMEEYFKPECFEIAQNQRQISLVSKKKMQTPITFSLKQNKKEHSIIFFQISLHLLLDLRAPVISKTVQSCLQKPQNLAQKYKETYLQNMRTVEVEKFPAQSASIHRLSLNLVLADDCLEGTFDSNLLFYPVINE